MCLELATYTPKAPIITSLHLHNRIARHCLPAGRQGQGVNSIIILNTKFKALYAAVCG